MSIAARARRAVRPPPAYGTEDALQADIVRALRLAVRPGVIVHHPVNEGTGDPRRGKRNRRLGVLPGMPDLSIYGPDGRARGIEVKLPGRYPSAVQRERHAELLDAGVPVRVARSIEDAMAAAREWGLLRPEPARGERRAPAASATTPTTRKGDRPPPVPQRVPSPHEARP